MRSLPKKYRRKVKRRGQVKGRPLELGDESVIQVWHLLEGDRREGVTPWRALKDLLEFLDGELVARADFCRWHRWIRGLDSGALRARNLYQELLEKSLKAEGGRERGRRHTNLGSIEKKALTADRKGQMFVPPENSGRPTLLRFLRK